MSSLAPTTRRTDDSRAETVVLLDAEGNPVGVADKAAVHTSSTPLHLAFSCHIVNAAGDVLVTRRALTKKTWPGVWTNSVCGHPAPGESFTDAIARRTREELGMEVRDVVVAVPDFRYRAVDDSGVVENEVCPVYTARTDDEPVPDPSEVMAHAWVSPSALRRTIDVAPWALSPWLVEHAPALELLAPDSP